VRAVRAVRGIVAGIVAQHRGRLADFTGDSFLAEFLSAVDAVSAALSIQRESAVLGADLPEEKRLRLRVGIHAGELRVDGGAIYGDAIHVAARLQTLAEPGELCISSTVREELAGKLEVRVRDLGMQTLKNIARPVSAWAVSPQPSGGSVTAPVPGFSGRPAIAVLPFDNLSGDPEQAYFCDGIAEDLITRLATHRDFPLIARNSSFAYRGRAVDVKQIGRELGIAYLVEGSVRRAGSRVRTTAQLIEVRTGHHLWAERYDRGLADVFAIQDEIVDAIVGRVYPEVIRAERGRVTRTDPADLSAWDLALQAQARAEVWSREDLREARALAERALALDPRSIEALQVLSRVRSVAHMHLWSELCAGDPAALADRIRDAMKLSGGSWQAWLALGRALRETRDVDAANDAFRRAIAINPSSSEARLVLATTLVSRDELPEAFTLIDTALRLDPTSRDLFFRNFVTAWASFAAGRHAEAVSCAEAAMRAAPGHPGSLRVLAASLAESDRVEEARRVVGRLRELAPGMSLSTLAQILPGIAPSLLERLTAALHKAGVPE